MKILPRRRHQQHPFPHKQALRPWQTVVAQTWPARVQLMPLQALVQKPPTVEPEHLPVRALRPRPSHALFPRLQVDPRTLPPRPPQMLAAWLLLQVGPPLPLRKSPSQSQVLIRPANDVALVSVHGLGCMLELSPVI